MSSISSPALSIPASTSSLPTNPFQLPPADASKEVWQKFIKDSTERVDGVDPDLAQVICLGDIHTEKWQDAWRDGLIDHYGSDGDIVLVEGFNEGWHVFPMLARLIVKAHKKVDVYGCDDTALIKDTKTWIQKVVDLTGKYHETSVTSRWTEEDTTAWKKACEQIETNCTLRSQIMIKTARGFLKSLKSGQKIFMIAGSDHFFNDKGYKIVNSLATVKVSSILPKDASQNKEADLIQAKTLLKGYS